MYNMVAYTIDTTLSYVASEMNDLTAPFSSQMVFDEWCARLLNDLNDDSECIIKCRF